MNTYKGMIVDIETVPIYSLNDVMSYGKYSPHPLKEKIVCLCTLDLDTGIVHSFSGDEKFILESFWEEVENKNNLWGFNIEGFDMVYIRTRSLLHDVNIRNYRVYDIKHIIYHTTSMWKGKLQEFAKELHLSVTEDNNGSNVYEHYKNNELHKIIEHCEEDVKICFEIIKKMKKVGMIDE